MTSEFYMGLAIPAAIAIGIKVWDNASAGTSRNRDLMQKILLQLERHEVLFQEIQKDIHEVREKI
ncbi:hypothetical protein [Nostoc sp. C117]|uniref:hypothetical protein n=1 Tax=Nostoc sp. C117 TaxID=3349875 RepID=UPI00370D90F8